MWFANPSNFSEFDAMLHGGIKDFANKINDILKNKIVTNEEIDWNAVVDDYEVKDGFYIFKFNKDAYFFINNTLMDCCPGYYAEAGEGHGKHF